MTLSVCIITFNEEEDLPRCLASVAGLATQIVVVDSLSSDRTREIAIEAGAEVSSRPFEGHVKQKQFALGLARDRWVLCLDADEWLDDELRAALAELLGREQQQGPEDDGGPVAYELNRRTSYLGAWIEHGGWSPEWRLRLARRGRARWAGVDPHDRLEAEGTVGRLPGRLNHRPYRNLSEHFGKLGSYTDIMVARRLEAGERGSLAAMVLRPPGRFLRMYLLRAGVFDGWRGFVLAVFGAFYVFLKYAKLYAATHAGAADRDRAG